MLSEMLWLSEREQGPHRSGEAVAAVERREEEKESKCGQHLGTKLGVPGVPPGLCIYELFSPEDSTIDAESRNLI